MEKYTDDEILLIKTIEEYTKRQIAKAYSYIDKVKSGEILTNVWIKKTIALVEKDINQENEYEIRQDKLESIFDFLAILTISSNGEYDHFELLEWEAFLVFALFGTYKKGTDKRRYQVSLLWIARKNGKTTLVAALVLYMLFFDKVVFPQILLVAYNEEGTKRAIEEITGFLKRSPSLLSAVRLNRSEVYLTDKDRQGFCQTIASKEAALQGFKLSSAILDEVHTYKDNSLYSAAKEGMTLKQVPNPMLFMVSSAGDKRNTFLRDRIKYSKDILDGKVKDDTFFPLLYTLDDEDLKQWKNPELWIKANPSLHTLKDFDKMMGLLNEAKYFPNEKYKFVTFELNVYTDSVKTWIPETLVKQIMKHIDENDLQDKELYLGGDFSNIEDLSAIAALWYMGSGKFKSKIFYFAANNDKVFNRKGNTNIQKWIDEGYINLSKLGVIDDDDIISLIKDLSDKYTVFGFGYDKRLSGRIVELSKNYISSMSIKPIQQGFGLSTAIKEVQRMVHFKNIEIEDNPVTLWNFNNVVSKTDDFGNCALSKTKSLESIDGIVALCNAYRVYELINHFNLGDEERE